jgi:integrase
MTKTSNKLTSQDLKNLAVGQTAYGSNLRATRNKSGITYYASFTLDGERYQHKLGTDAKMTLTDAFREAAQYRATKEREHELLGDDSAKANMTFAEAAPMYMSFERTNRGKNIVEKEQHFRLHILPELADKEIKAFTSKAARRFVTTLREKGLKDGTVKRIFATIGKFYSHAVEEEWLMVKPYSIEIKDETVVSRNPIPERHKLALLATARRQDQHPMIFLFILIGFEVGMRHREILNMRFEDVNFETGNVWLPESKVGSRVQPLTPLVLKELQALKRKRGVDEGYVFKSDTAKTGRINRMNHAFKRLCKAAGVPTSYTPHNMRHSCVTELVAMGFSDRQVATYTGHRTPAMISWYTKAEVTPKQADAMKARGERLMASIQ